MAHLHLIPLKTNWKTVANTTDAVDTSLVVITIIIVAVVFNVYLLHVLLN